MSYNEQNIHNNSRPIKGAPIEEANPVLTVIVGVLLDTEPLLYKDSEDNYTGLIMDVWEQITKKANIKSKYIYIEKPNYNNEIKNLNKEKYDVLIGDISVISERSKLANYTRTLFLSKDVIVFKRNDTFNTSFLSSILKIFIKPLAIFLGLGFLFGYILYLFDKKRGLHWSLWGTIGSLLGEPGTIVERANIKKHSALFSSGVILLVAFFFTMYLQSIITAKSVTYLNKYDPHLKSIIDNKMLVNEGDSHIFTLIHHGAEPVYIKKDENSRDNYLKSLKNKKEIDGYITTIINAKRDVELYPSLSISEYDFGYDQIAFMVKKNRNDLLQRINTSIVKLQENNFIKNKCELYLPNKERICDI